MKTQPLAHPHPICGIIDAVCFIARPNEKMTAKNIAMGASSKMSGTLPARSIKTLLYLGELNDSQRRKEADLRVE